MSTDGPGARPDRAADLDGSPPTYDVMRPLWLVAALAIAAGAVLLVLVLAGFLEARDRQFALLAGVALAVIGGYVLALGVARRDGRPDRGAWAIAIVQLVGALVATLLVTDLWMIGLSLLFVVPLQIAIADRPRRIPLAIILALLGVASMVALDLLDPPGR